MAHFVFHSDPPAVAMSMRPRRGHSKNPSVDLLPVSHLPSIIQDPRLALAKRRGNEALEKLDYRGALTAYSEAIDRDQGMKHPKLYFRRGLALEKLGLLMRSATDYAVAFNLTGGASTLEAYENVYKLLHSGALPAFSDGEAAFVKENYKLAISYYTRAIEIDNTCNRSYFKRGLAYEQLGEYSCALQDVVKAEYRCAVVNMRNACRNAATRIEVKLFEGAEVLKRRADRAFEKEEWKIAIREYSGAIKVAPEYGDLWYQRGLTYERYIDLGRALADLIHAQTLLYRPNSLKMCTAAIERIHTKMHKNAQFAKNRGDMYYKTFEWRKASWWYTRAVKIDPMFADPYLFRGLCRESLGKLDKADKDIRRAKELFKNQVFLENCDKALDRIHSKGDDNTSLSKSKCRSPLTTWDIIARRRLENFRPPRSFTFPELTNKENGSITEDYKPIQASHRDKPLNLSRPVTPKSMPELPGQPAFFSNQDNRRQSVDYSPEE
eukprot:gb/GEZN01004836.1/.p1 GENE.gb/GEZN01004836.1/~~gb/GEZN01004836.1/.p1  ORF type:complete len:517 (+),score=41.31 gb/GEZN01004836.1/:72-1553(+)